MTGTTKPILTPRESGEHIVKHAKHLLVKPEGIQKLAQAILQGLKDKTIDVTNFSQHTIHPNAENPKAMEWIFVVDTLNFCFWTPSGKKKYAVDGQTGYFALCAAMNRAIADGYDMTNAEFYSKIDLKTLQHIFRSDDGETQVPLLEKRLECLHEVGQQLLSRWQGKFENVVKAASNSAGHLLQLVVDEFPCFRDEAVYEGQRVAIYKRAQILVGDLWACYAGRNPVCDFKDLDCITMFADYRVPQVLVHFGSLAYGDGLWDTLKNDVILPNGDEREVEIRGASIYIVEQVKDAVKRELAELPEGEQPIVNSILIDHFLWDYRRKYAEALEKIPFHKTISIYY